jgi:phosphoglycerate dehydrogenase-like enzyme
VVGLQDAQALVWPDWTGPERLAVALAGAPGVRWVQLVTSGVDAVRHLLDDGRTWTSAKGAYAVPMAEHVLAVLLAVLRRLPEHARSADLVPRPATTLHGTRVTVLGAGGVTAALLPLLAPFGCHTTVVRRRREDVPGADAVARLADLPALAPTTDVLVVALALTPETHHVVDGRLLALLPRNAHVVNVARGAHVDSEALARALAAGHLAGASLDVTDPEPLPAAHPLRTLDRCLVTPHVACPPELARPYLLERVRTNVARARAGADLIGRVDVRLGY